MHECDRCGKEPAYTWLITGPDGSPREIELCDQHGAPIANAYALARPVRKKAPRGSRARQPEKAPAPKPAAAPTPVPAPEPEPIWR